MAGKFKIFCDDPSARPTLEPEDKPMSQVQLQPTATTQQQQVSQQLQAQQPQQSQPPKNNHDNHQLTAAASLSNSNSNNNVNKLVAANEQEKFIALNQHVVSNTTVASSNPLQPLKREPLGLRQPLTQAITATTTTTTVGVGNLASTTDALNSSSSSNLSINEENQENDISMASLGSDFVPSILHDDDDEQEDEEDEFATHSFDEEDYESQIETNASYIMNSDNNALIDDEEDLDDDDFDDADEELQMELSQAFKRHDESQLFKSVVFIDDIKAYLWELEREPELRPLPNYMDFQREIDSDKRAILINWLVEVSDEYNLESETLFICTGIIDRFLSKMSIPTCNFQLLGVAAMFIASKYEEIYPPNLYNFVEVTDDTYSGQQIRQMEQEILKTLNFRISLPTISFFLRQIFAFNKFTKKVYHLAEYLCYLSLLDDQPFLEYYPSDIALAAVILAANQLQAETSISPELKTAYDKSNLDQLQRRNLPKATRLRDIERRVYIVDKDLPFCIESLRALQQRAHSSSSRLPIDTAIVNKYSAESHNKVALLVPPKAEDLYLY